MSITVNLASFTMALAFGALSSGIAAVAVLMWRLCLFS